jgi:hypothetical protein
MFAGWKVSQDARLGFALSALTKAIFCLFATMTKRWRQTVVTPARTEITVIRIAVTPYRNVSIISS